MATTTGCWGIPQTTKPHRQQATKTTTTTATTLQRNQQRHMRRPLAAIAQKGSPGQVPGTPLKG